MNHNPIKELSIQISLSGLSFCILNRTLSSVEFIHHERFEKQANPFETLAHLKEVLTSYKELNQSFFIVKVIYQNGLSNLVPKEFFDEEQSADYLKFNSKILNTDYISHDEISVNESVNVYVPYVNINNFIFDTFGEFEYKHASTILIETILQKATTSDQQLYININTHDFELIAIKDKQLILYNSYEYSSKEDVIYYILFAMEQLQFSPETIKLKLMGLIKKNDALYEMIYTYVRFVEFYEPTYRFEFKDSLKSRQEHNDVILLHSFS